VENIAFGVGLPILVLGRRWFVHRTTTTAWLSAAWLLASWMPHAALHQHIGMQPAALLPVEWVFHGGAILAIASLLAALAGTATKRSAGATPSSARSQADHERPDRLTRRRPSAESASDTPAAADGGDPDGRRTGAASHSIAHLPPNPRALLCGHKEELC
jgi:hypothetical protein